MAAAPLGAGDPRDVDAAVGGAQGDLAPALLALPEQVADQSGNGRPLDGAQVVDDALGVVLLGARLEVVGRGQVGERQRSTVIALDVGEPARQQLELAVGDPLVQAVVDLVDRDPGVYLATAGSLANDGDGVALL